MIKPVMIEIASTLKRIKVNAMITAREINQTQGEAVKIGTPKPNGTSK